MPSVNCDNHSLKQVFGFDIVPESSLSIHSIAFVCEPSRIRESFIIGATFQWKGYCAAIRLSNIVYPKRFSSALNMSLSASQVYFPQCSIFFKYVLAHLYFP